ncbi:hypothetical protein ABBQ38_014438 [Trebouxia sp. C0009 RCD-2024]
MNPAADQMNRINSGSRVSGKGQERPAAQRQKRARIPDQDYSAGPAVTRAKRVRFNEHQQADMLTHHSRGRAQCKSHGKEPTASTSAPDQAEQHGDVRAANNSKRLHAAHALKKAAKTKARTNNAKSPTTHEERQCFCAPALDPAAGSSHTAQEPSIAVGTHAARQKGSSTSHAQNPVGVSIYTAHQAATATSAPAVTRDSSSLAHAKDLAAEGFQTAPEQLPASKARAGPHVPDPTAHDLTESSHVTQVIPLAARTRSATRAPTVTASRGKRKEPAAIIVEAEEHCRGAKRARAGCASTHVPEMGSTCTASLPGTAVLKKKTSGRPAKTGPKRLPAKAVSNARKRVNGSIAKHALNAQ